MLRQPAETFDGERQVRAALVRRNGVQFVEDQRACALERLASAFGREQNEQRLGGRDQHVRGSACVDRAFLLWRIAGAHGDADIRQRRAPFGGDLGYLLQRTGEVALDVVRQRLQRRDVNDLCSVRQAAIAQGLFHEHVQAREKRSQRLAGAGRRSDERMTPGCNGRPALGLRVRGRAKAPLEPRLDNRMKRSYCHRARFPMIRFPHKPTAKEMSRAQCTS